MKSKLELKEVKKASQVLRALNHKLRQEILNIIDEKGQISVTEIYTKLNIEQSVASQHLAVLRLAKIVKTNKDGKFVKYSVDHARINQIEKFVEQLLK